MPRAGAWHAEIESSDDVGPPATAKGATITDDGVSFVGTVIPGRGGVIGGRWKGKIVGGAGGLTLTLDAKNYSSSVGVKVSQVVADILREAGETLSTTADQGTLGTGLGQHWERVSGPASRALVAVLDAIGAGFRVLADGSVWVGPETYPTATIDHVLLDEDWIAGVTDIAPTRPDLTPGVTFLGHRISYVVHKIEPDALRTEAYVNSPGNVLERIFGNLRTAIDYSRPYPCAVVSQNGDGTLQLDPDDKKLKGTGLDNVPIRCGIPAKVEVSGGARCVLEFDAGDPKRPFVSAWETSSVDKIRINSGAIPTAFKGGMVTVVIGRDGLTDALFKIAANLLCAVPGSPPTVNPASLLTLPAAPIMAPGTITVGREKTLV